MHLLYPTVAFLIGGTTTAALPAAQDANLPEVQSQIAARAAQMRRVTVAVSAGTSRASGVVLQQGFVLTTAHAVAAPDQPAIVTLSDGTTLDCQVHAIDRFHDVALLRFVKQPKPPGAKLRREPLPKQTATLVVAAGHSGGFDKARGTVLRFGSAVGGDVVQSTCRLSPGDSGGPLFDLEGQVVGIHRQIRPADSSNFHTSVASLLPGWNRLSSGGTIDPRTAPQPVVRALEPPTAPGSQQVRRAIVVVAGDSGQRVAGTVVGPGQRFILTKLSEVRGDQLKVGCGQRWLPAEVAATHRGWDLALLRVAESLPQAIAFEPSARVPEPGQLVLSPATNAAPQDCRIGIIGASPTAVPRARGALGLVADDQLLVREIRPNSAAAACRGLAIGDRLVQIEDVRLRTTMDLRAALEGFAAGDRVALSFERAGKPMSCLVRLRLPPGERFAKSPLLQQTLSPRRSDFPRIVQHDATIAAAQCGGPVVTPDGHVLGLNIARASREAVCMIPASDVRAVLDEMLREVAARDAAGPGRTAEEAP